MSAPKVDTTGWPEHVAKLAEEQPRHFAERVPFKSGEWFLPFGFRHRMHYFPSGEFTATTDSGRVVRGAETACGRIFQVEVVFSAPIGGPWAQCRSCDRWRRRIYNETFPGVAS